MFLYNARDMCNIRELWWWCVYFLIGVCAFAQNRAEIHVVRHGTNRTERLVLNESDVVWVKAVPGAPRSLAFDTFVYESSGDLVAMDDPEINAESFEWKAPTRGEYYLVFRNTSDVDGEVQVSVDRSKGNQGPPRPAANFAQIRVFYATNRKKGPSSENGATYLGERDEADRLSYGNVVVSIPRAPKHQMGELEGPSIFRLEFRGDPNKHVVLQSVSEKSGNEFYREIGERVKESPGAEALVFIHGFRTTFEDAARRTAQISYDLGFDGAPILYSWPSSGTLTGYLRDQTKADLSVSPLEDFLSTMAAHSGARTIYVIAHSMGNRVLAPALSAIGKHTTPDSTRFRQVVLMAPDIDSELFARMAQSIKASAEHVTLYASSRDLALEASTFLAGAPRAGLSGTSLLILPNLMDTIDVSNVDTSLLGFDHQYYGDNQTILSDLFYLLRGEPVEKRFGLDAATGASGGYWVFRKAAR
jgi:esterase/lipase superfamily enzyme